MLWRIAEIVHEADLDDERYHAPELAGLDVVRPGLAMLNNDDRMLELTSSIFDGRYEYPLREHRLGHA